MRFPPIVKPLFSPRYLCALAALLALALPVMSQTRAKTSKPAAKPSAQPATNEERTTRALEAARSNPLELHEFLRRMPKGTDLHNHLAGAVYAETWIRDGAEDNLCVDLATLSFFKTQAMMRSIPPQPVCGEGHARAAQAFEDQHLYDSLVDAFSMRAFVPSAGVSSHDHFFDAFAKFLAVDPRHTGAWLDEVSARAAAQNEQYLELMDTPEFNHTIAIAKEIGWKDDLAALRQALLKKGLRDDIAVARAHWDEASALRDRRQHCGKADASANCRVEIRFLYQILRGFPKEQVFAQTLLGFEVAAADPRVVGINMVMPEDAHIPMRDYAEQMRMVGFFHGLYPQVHITLHAGEIAPGLVTREGLCCHIRLAVEEAHAERIGHGVDVMYENDPYALLKKMAEKHVMVEINLTSNDVILGISGHHHPLPIYRRLGVPVALSTDDEGVSRIDLTHEYVRAVETYGLRYEDLKQIVRTGMEHSFLLGESLWTDSDAFHKLVGACSGETFEAEKLGPSCQGFLQQSEKAQQQAELERRFKIFEATF
jgi:adenosine deaminase